MLFRGFPLCKCVRLLDGFGVDLGFSYAPGECLEFIERKPPPASVWQGHHDALLVLDGNVCDGGGGIDGGFEGLALRWGRSKCVAPAPRPGSRLVRLLYIGVSDPIWSSSRSGGGPGATAAPFHCASWADFAARSSQARGIGLPLSCSVLRSAVASLLTGPRRKSMRPRYSKAPNDSVGGVAGHEFAARGAGEGSRRPV